MKILFIGDQYNLHAGMAEELRHRGHNVTLVSDDKTCLKSPEDIFIQRKKGFKGSFSYLFKLFSLLPDFKGYDVVQLANADFLDLNPGRTKYFFDKIKEQNGSVFLSLINKDYFYYKACKEDKLYRFSEFKVEGEPTELLKQKPEILYKPLSKANKEWTEYLYEKINGAFSFRPEYDLATREILGDRLIFTNMPFDLDRISYHHLDLKDKIKFFIDITKGKDLEKGTRKLLTILKELEKEYADKIEIISVSNIEPTEYSKKQKSGHIILNNLYGFSPDYQALMSMASGRIVATGVQSGYYDYLKVDSPKPFIELSPDNFDIKRKMEMLINNSYLLEEISVKGRAFIEKNNDVRNIIEKFISHWESFS